MLSFSANYYYHIFNKTINPANITSDNNLLRSVSQYSFYHAGDARLFAGHFLHSHQRPFCQSFFPFSAATHLRTRDLSVISEHDKESIFAPFIFTVFLFSFLFLSKYWRNLSHTCPSLCQSARKSQYCSLDLSVCSLSRLQGANVLPIMISHVAI